MVPLFAFSQASVSSSRSFSQVKVFPSRHFRKTIPAGNYSGIAPLGNDRYAVVSDKTKEDGFFIFHLKIDTLKGRITEAYNEGYYSSGQKNRDIEAIVYRPSSSTLFISGEADNEVYEYGLDGKHTGRRLQMPDCYKHARRNLGLESLAYDTLTRCFYTTSERLLKGDTLLRIQSFDNDLKPLHQYYYRPDAPISRKYYYGVAELCALGNGRLLVMERQLRVPRLKIGAKSVIRIYEVHLNQAADESLLEKKLLTEFKTRNMRFANFEGLCTPYPGWLLLIADSQDQYKGILKDWFRLVRY